MCSALTLAWTVFLDPLTFRILVPQPNLCRHTRIRNVRENNHKVRCFLFTLHNSVFRPFVICQNYAAQVIWVIKKLLSSNAINKMIRWLDIFLDLCGFKKSFICMQTSARPWMHPYFLAFWCSFAMSYPDFFLYLY